MPTISSSEALQLQPHSCFGANALRDQSMRDAVRAAVQLGIGQRGARVFALRARAANTGRSCPQRHRHGIRPPPRLLFNQSMQRLRDFVLPPRLAPRAQRAQLRVIENPNLTHDHRRRISQRLQQSKQVPPPPLYRLRVEQLRRVDHLHAEPAVLVLGGIQREIELRCLFTRCAGLQGQPGQLLQHPTTSPLG